MKITKQTYRWQKAFETSRSARERENTGFEAFPIGAGFSLQRNRCARYTGFMVAGHIRRQHKAYGTIAIVDLEVLPNVLNHNRRDPFVSLCNKGVPLDWDAGLVGKQVFPASVELLFCPASKLEVRRVLAYITKFETFPFMSFKGLLAMEVMGWVEYRAHPFSPFSSSSRFRVRSTDKLELLAELIILSDGVGVSGELSQTGSGTVMPSGLTICRQMMHQFRDRSALTLGYSDACTSLSHTGPKMVE